MPKVGRAYPLAELHLALRPHSSSVDMTSTAPARPVCLMGDLDTVVEFTGYRANRT